MRCDYTAEHRWGNELNVWLWQSQLDYPNEECKYRLKSFLSISLLPYYHYTRKPTVPCVV